MSEHKSGITENNLRYLVEAVRLGSLTKAAAELGKQKSTVKEGITNLASSLGKDRLLWRGHNPTFDGRRLYASCKEILKLMDGLKRELRASPILVGVTDPSMRLAGLQFGYFYKDTLQEPYQPQVVFKEQHEIGELLNLLPTVILTTSPEGLPQSCQPHCEVWCKDHLIFVGPEKIERLEELRGRNFIMPKYETPHHVMVRELLRKNNVDVNVIDHRQPSDLRDEIAIAENAFFVEPYYLGPRGVTARHPRLIPSLDLAGADMSELSFDVYGWADPDQQRPAVVKSWFEDFLDARRTSLEDYWPRENKPSANPFAVANDKDFSKLENGRVIMEVSRDSFEINEDTLTFNADFNGESVEVRLSLAGIDKAVAKAKQ